MVIEKSENNIDDIELDYMRKEVQKIIDNHLKDSGESFSVMNYNKKELLLVIDLLTNKLSWEDLEKKYKNDKNEFMRTYEEIRCYYDYISQIINKIKNTKIELAELKSDLELESNLKGI